MDKLRALEYFLVSAEERSFTRAARRLEVSVPAIAKLVTALEREIGAICRKAARRRAEGDEASIEVTGEVVVEMLGAPDALRPLVGRGPLRDDTVWLSALLADPAITRAVAVSVGEELVVTETTELVARLAVETKVTVTAVVANRHRELADMEWE